MRHILDVSFIDPALLMPLMLFFAGALAGFVDSIVAVAD